MSLLENRSMLLNADEPDEFERHMPSRKRIVLVAHDNRKLDLISWVNFNQEVLKEHDLFGTGTTGRLIQEQTGIPVYCFQSGPLGGDQQIGAELSYGNLDLVIFFWDPMSAQPHDPDVKALLRLSVLYNTPTACNRATADFLISSELFHGKYQQRIINYAKRRPPVPIP